MMITLIFARAENGVIGLDGTLPWHLPADLKRFKVLTMGKPMIMGRRTFESFPAPLPGRRHIVLTRDPDWSSSGAEVVHSPSEALTAAGADTMVIGGAEIFALFETVADRAECTVVHRDYEGDTRFALDEAQWAETAREDHDAEKERPAYTFLTLEKRRSPSYSAPHAAA